MESHRRAAWTENPTTNTIEQRSLVRLRLAPHAASLRAREGCSTEVWLLPLDWRSLLPGLGAQRPAIGSTGARTNSQLPTIAAGAHAMANASRRDSAATIVTAGTTPDKWEALAAIAREKRKSEYLARRRTSLPRLDRVTSKVDSRTLFWRGGGYFVFAPAMELGEPGGFSRRKKKLLYRFFFFW